MPRLKRRTNKARLSGLPSEFEVVRIDKLHWFSDRRYHHVWDAYGDAISRRRAERNPGRRLNAYWEIDHPELVEEVRQHGQAETLRAHALLYDGELERIPKIFLRGNGNAETQA